MGREMLAQTEQQTGFYADSSLQAYVSQLGLRMARASERPNLPWEFHVIDDPQVNAFAAPGGFIFITRGILAYLNSEAELAAVVGHEIGHVTARHSAAMASQQMLAQGGLAIGGILRPDLASGALGQLLGAGASLYFLQFSRNDEKQADGLGFRYSLTAGYDPREMPNTFRTLERVSDVAGSSVPAFLSTHPDPGDRVKYTQAWADTVTNLKGLEVDRDRFLSHIDGIVFGDDPEQGYFEGTRFLHPGLKLRFDVPAGWQTANQASAVIAVEPKGQAQLALSSAREASVDAAAQAFAAQQGIQSLGTQRFILNGMQAAAVQFAANSSQGQSLRGTVYFVQHAGQVLQFIGLAVAGNWSSLAGVIDRSLQSLAPTPVGQVFRKRAWLKVITLRRPTTTADLLAQSSGGVTKQVLAMLNGVADDATIPAGRKAKIVVVR